MGLKEDITGLLTIDLANKPKHAQWFSHTLLPELSQFTFKCKYDTNFTSSPSIITDATVSITKFEESIFDDFNEYAHQTGITNWIVAGGSWQKCIHYNRVGFLNLSSIKDINFYAAPWSVFDDDTLTTVTHTQFENDHLIKWEQHREPGFNNCYKLIGAK